MNPFRFFLFLVFSAAIVGPASGQFLPGTALPGLDHRIYALATFDDGSGPALYATGIFTSGDGTPLNSIAKWNGATWSPLGLGIGNPATAHLWTGWSLVTHDDGSGEALYVGGRFFQASGVPALNIARWDGQGWSALGEGLEDIPFDLAVYDDGNGPALYATGSPFGVQMWNGSTWQTLPGFNSVGRAMAVFDDGGGDKLYVGGAFDIDGQPANGIAAWDGTAWHALAGVNGIAGVGGDSIYTLATYDDGSGTKLYAGGGFQTAGGIASPFLAAWTGSAWQAVTGMPVQEDVTELVVYDDGNGPKLVVGLNILNDGSVVLAWDGQSWTELAEPGRLTPGSVFDLAVLDDGQNQTLFAAGSMLRSGVVNTISRLGQWDGTAWSNVARPDLVGLDRQAFGFATYDDGSGEALYVGGSFYAAGNAFAKGIARYETTSWTGLRNPNGDGLAPPDEPFDADVIALAAFDDGSQTLGGANGRLYAVGTFLGGGDTPLQHIAAWDGTTWQPVGGGLDGWGEALQVFDDGNGPALYIGGRFSTAGGVTVNGIARWDGVSYSTLSGGPDIGVNGIVGSLAVFDDGFGPALYAGGIFSEAGGVNVEHLAVWRPKSGWGDVGGFDVGAGSVGDLEVYDDGTGPALYITGSFITVNDVTVNGIVKWDGSEFSLLSGPEGIGLGDEGGPGSASSLEAYDAGGGTRLYVAGDFDTAGGRTAHNVASWDGTSWHKLIGDQPLAYDVTFGAGTPTASRVFGYDDGEPTLFISGRFSEIGGVTSFFLSRYRDKVAIFVDGFESGDVTAWSNSAEAAE